MVQDGVSCGLLIPARLCRAKWGRPIRAAWIIRAPGEGCTLTLVGKMGGVWGVGAEKGKQAQACFWQESVTRAPALPLTPGGRPRSQGWSGGWGQCGADELMWLQGQWLQGTSPACAAWAPLSLTFSPLRTSLSAQRGGPQTTGVRWGVHGNWS